MVLLGIEMTSCNRCALKLFHNMLIEYFDKDLTFVVKRIMLYMAPLPFYGYLKEIKERSLLHTIIISIAKWVLR